MNEAELLRQLESTLSDYLAPLSVTKALFGWHVFNRSGDQVGNLYLIGKNWRLVLPGKGIDVTLEYRCPSKLERKISTSQAKAVGKADRLGRRP